MRQEAFEKKLSQLVTKYARLIQFANLGTKKGREAIMTEFQDKILELAKKAY